jgi:hypothetical protein
VIIALYVRGYYLARWLDEDRLELLKELLSKRYRRDDLEGKITMAFEKDRESFWQEIDGELRSRYGLGCEFFIKKKLSIQASPYSYFIRSASAALTVSLATNTPRTRIDWTTSFASSGEISSCRCSIPKTAMSSFSPFDLRFSKSLRL